MVAIFKVVDYIYLSNVGDIYFIDGCQHNVLCIGDVLQDSSGNRFRVKSIEMIRRDYGDIDIEDIPIAMRFDIIDGVKIAGINTYLFKYV